MKVNDFTKLLSLAGHCDEIYVTDCPEIHKKAGGIVIAAFEILEPGSKTKGIIRRFTIVAGKQAEGLGMPLTYRVERPEWFGPLGEYSQTLKAESAENPGRRIARFFRWLFSSRGYDIGALRPISVFKLIDFDKFKIARLTDECIETLKNIQQLFLRRGDGVTVMRFTVEKGEIINLITEIIEPPEP